MHLVWRNVGVKRRGVNTYLVDDSVLEDVELGEEEVVAETTFENFDPAQAEAVMAANDYLFFHTWSSPRCWRAARWVGILSILKLAMLHIVIWYGLFSRFVRGLAYKRRLCTRSLFSSMFFQFSFTRLPEDRSLCSHTFQRSIGTIGGVILFFPHPYLLYHVHLPFL